MRLRSRGGRCQSPPPPSAAAVTPTRVCCRHFFLSSGASATYWQPGALAAPASLHPLSSPKSHCSAGHWAASVQTGHSGEDPRRRLRKGLTLPPKFPTLLRSCAVFSLNGRRVEPLWPGSTTAGLWFPQTLPVPGPQAGNGQPAPKGPLRCQAMAPPTPAAQTSSPSRGSGSQRPPCSHAHRESGRCRLTDRVLPSPACLEHGQAAQPGPDRGTAELAAQHWPWA